LSPVSPAAVERAAAPRRGNRTALAGDAAPPGKHWQYLPKKLDELDARGEIYWSPNGNPRRKVYLDDNPGVGVQDIWLDFRDAHNQNIRITGYPTEKNPDLLKRIIEASSNPGDLVLDCYSGSGTTLAVSSELGRRWVGVDNSPEAIATTLERFGRGIQPMGDFVGKRRQKRPGRATPSLYGECEEDRDSRPAAQGIGRSISDFTFFAESDADLLAQSTSASWRKHLDHLDGHSSGTD
jgi:adenine-specific DNA-methyltransferase